MERHALLLVAGLNLIHDGSDQVTQPLNDSARFFYTAKASKDDRDKGNTIQPLSPLI